MSCSRTICRKDIGVRIDWPTMSIQSLNEDTLDTVFTYISSKDARRLGATARVFYATAKRHAVKDVTTHSFRQAVKFCNYMTRHSPELLPRLRSFRMECFLAITRRPAYLVQEEEEYKDGAARIVDLLQKARNLRVLALHEAELLMIYEPRIATIVSSMRSLLELELEDIGPRVSGTLRCLQSTPDKVALAGASHWASFASTLRTRWIPKPNPPTFPSVRALSLRGDRHLPRLSELAHMFPNVVVLDMGHELKTELPLAMKCFHPVAFTGPVRPSYPTLKDLFAGERARRLRYVVAEPADLEWPQNRPGLTTFLGLWVSRFLGSYIIHALITRKKLPFQTALNRQRGVVCLKVRFFVPRPYGNIHLVEHQASFGSSEEDQNNVLATLPQWATKVVSLRYLSLEFRPSLIQQVKHPLSEVRINHTTFLGLTD